MRRRRRRSRAGFAPEAERPGERLTGYQRSIAEQHIELVELVAAEVRSRAVRYDERFSAAQLGLCDAALRWTPGTPGCFRGFARTRMRWYVLREIRDRRRCFRDAPPLAADPPCRCEPFADAGTRDEVEWALARLGLLTGRQREAVTLLAAGLTRAEVGRRMRLCDGSVFRLLRDAAGRIRAARVEDANLTAPRSTPAPPG